MEIDTLTSVYFVGIGGIGMSALARFFLSKGKVVAGYDRTPTELTRRLEDEGAHIHYEDNCALIPEACTHSATTLVVYTPAIPATHTELCYFREGGFQVHKRAQVLGTITHSYEGLCVAGTHGKTTTSTMLAHLLHQSEVGASAFLGGISNNYHTNLLLSQTSRKVVIEADEFDRSFHWLTPYMSVITAIDPDHLDVYGTAEAYRESFVKYTSLIRPDGVLLLHEGLHLQPAVQPGVKVYTYGREQGDFHASRIRIGDGRIVFDYVSPAGTIADVELGVPVSINIDNGIAAMAIAQLNGVSDEELREGMATFSGVERRFDFQLKTPDKVFLTDYAHHPEEIRQSILSMRELYAGRRLTGIFQPHLYTRTRDFYAEFADSLSLLDEVILLDIYPAREQPIPGVTSQLIYDRLRPGVMKTLVHKDELLATIASKRDQLQVLMALGAGDVVNFTRDITDILTAGK